MQQENLLQSIKEDLRVIQRQLTTIQQSLEELSEKDSRKKVETTKAKSPRSSINKAHKEARRFARSWSEKRTHQKEET
jgi:HAMP domain-containing protein